MWPNPDDYFLTSKKMADVKPGTYVVYLGCVVFVIKKTQNDYNVVFIDGSIGFVKEYKVVDVLSEGINYEDVKPGQKFYIDSTCYIKSNEKNNCAYPLDSGYCLPRNDTKVRIDSYEV